jgi:hypothetical protein
MVAVGAALRFGVLKDTRLTRVGAEPDMIVFATISFPEASMERPVPLAEDIDTVLTHAPPRRRVFVMFPS